VLDVDPSITLTSADFGKTIVVNDSGGGMTVNLPSVSAADIGATITVVKLGASRLTIDAPSGNYILNSTSGGTLYSDTVVATVTLRVSNSVWWMVVGSAGTWTAT
jgi:hypothetical protein